MDALGALLLIAAAAAAGETAPEPGPAAKPDRSPDQMVSRQSLDDARWTGPILAASAATLPKGHFLVEPYVYDVVRYGRYDQDGERQDAARVHGFGSLTYLLYGLADRVTIGLIPTFGFNEVDDGEDSSGLRLGDVSFQAQYRLTEFREGRRVPTMSVVLQETFPTGRHDRLGSRTSDGLGSGAYSTTVALYSQYYFWMPNGRILRTRLNLSRSFRDDARVEGVSVYGTQAGFRGRAAPGDTFTINSSWEYSATREWVLALDVFYQHDERTRVSGHRIESIDGVPRPIEIRENFDSGWQLGFAPAIEYNWSATAGVIIGARWIAAGRNADASITPVAAINLVY